MTVRKLAVNHDKDEDDSPLCNALVEGRIPELMNITDVDLIYARFQELAAKLHL